MGTTLLNPRFKSAITGKKQACQTNLSARIFFPKPAVIIAFCGEVDRKDEQIGAQLSEQIERLSRGARFCPRQADSSSKFLRKISILFSYKKPHDFNCCRMITKPVGQFPSKTCLTIKARSLGLTGFSANFFMPISLAVSSVSTEL